MKPRIGDIGNGSGGIDITFLDEPDHEDVASLYAYWNQARGGRPIPYRTDIDPVRIPALLPYILLIDELPPQGSGRIRLFGTGLVELFGEERTGLRFEDVGHTYGRETRGMVQERWAMLFGRIIETRQPLFAKTRLIGRERAYIRLHIGAFPLIAEQDSGEDAPPLSQIIAIVRPS